MHACVRTWGICTYTHTPKGVLSPSPTLCLSYTHPESVLIHTHTRTNSSTRCPTPTPQKTHPNTPINLLTRSSPLSRSLSVSHIYIHTYIQFHSVPRAHTPATTAHQPPHTPKSSLFLRQESWLHPHEGCRGRNQRRSCRL